MCNNKCLKQWSRPVDVKDRLPTKEDSDDNGYVLAWDAKLQGWDVTKFYHVDPKHDVDLTYWMRLPPSPEN